MRGEERKEKERGGGLGLKEKRGEEDEYWEEKGVFQSSLPNVREDLFC